MVPEALPGWSEGEGQWRANPLPDQSVLHMTWPCAGNELYGGIRWLKDVEAMVPDSRVLMWIHRGSFLDKLQKALALIRLAHLAQLPSSLDKVRLT